MKNIVEYSKAKLEFNLALCDLIVNYMKAILKSNSFYERIYISDFTISIVDKNGRYVDINKLSFKNTQKTDHLKKIIYDNRLDNFLCLNKDEAHNEESIKAFKIHIRNFK